MFGDAPTVVIEEDLAVEVDALVLVLEGVWHVVLNSGLDEASRQSVLNLAAYRVRTGESGVIVIDHHLVSA